MSSSPFPWSFKNGSTTFLRNAEEQAAYNRPADAVAALCSVRLKPVSPTTANGQLSVQRIDVADWQQLTSWGSELHTTTYLSVRPHTFPSLLAVIRDENSAGLVVEIYCIQRNEWLIDWSVIWCLKSHRDIPSYGNRYGFRSLQRAVQKQKRFKLQ